MKDTDKGEIILGLLAVILAITAIVLQIMGVK